MAPCWAGGRGEQRYNQIWRKWGEEAEWINMHQIVSMSLGVFLCTTYPTTNWVTRISFKIFSRKMQALKSIFNILSGFSHCVWQRNCSDTAMQKEGCTWDPGNFITPSQAVSVQHPGLCAACPARRTGNMAQTTLCVIATSHRALWYVHLPWLVLQISLMSLPPCLCSLASSHWSSPGCTTTQP